MYLIAFRYYFYTVHYLEQQACSRPKRGFNNTTLLSFLGYLDLLFHGYIKANMNIVYTLHAVQSLSCTKYKLHAQFAVENVISTIF